MLLNAISKENISMVDHYLDNSLTEKYKKIIENNIKNNKKQVFRQPNISNIYTMQENEQYITFQATVKYISYYVNRKTNKLIEGDDKTRITKTVVLKFRKNNVASKTLYNCPSCGAGLNINSTAICTYCNAPLDERFSQYVLCSIT
jgi:hypothetical protein